MAKQPFLPLFFGDLLASTATWEGEERALYVLLLAYQWTAGPIPPEPKRIARMAQYDERAFLTLWETVGKKFVRGDGGLVNVRLEEHRQKSERLSEQNRERARNAASKRWGDATSNAPSIATPDAIHPILSYPIPNHPKKVPSEPTTAAPQPTHEFDHIRALYPKRGGSQPWPRALKAAQARVKDGDSWDVLTEGVRRYAAFIRGTGKEGTEFVLQAATFFGPDKRYLEPWDLPATKADARYSANVSTARDWAEAKSESR